MPRFEIICGKYVVGWSEFELGDPPMGVAFGRFIPSLEYPAIQAEVVAATSGGTPVPQFSARVIGGQLLESSGGVHIADYSAEVGEEGIEVSVLGLSQPPYEELFPEHVAAYENRFKNVG